MAAQARQGQSLPELGTGSGMYKLGQISAENGQRCSVGKQSFLREIFAENTELSNVGQHNRLLLLLYYGKLCASNDTRMHQEQCALAHFILLFYLSCIGMEPAEPRWLARGSGGGERPADPAPQRPAAAARLLQHSCGSWTRSDAAAVSRDNFPPCSSVISLAAPTVTSRSASQLPADGTWQRPCCQITPEPAFLK